MSETTHRPDKGKPLPSMGKWIAVGIAIGAGIGVAAGNIPMGVSVGVAIGIVIGLTERRKARKSEP